MAVDVTPQESGETAQGSHLTPQGWALFWWLLIWFGSWLAIYLDGRETISVPLFIPLGVSLGAIALIAFWASWSWGAELEETSKMRNAIAGSFVVFYLVLLTDLLVLPSFRAQLEKGEETTTTTPTTAELEDLLSFGQDVLGKFTVMVTVIVGFYFASVAAENLFGGGGSSQQGEETTTGTTAETTTGTTTQSGPAAPGTTERGPAPS